MISIPHPHSLRASLDETTIGQSQAKMTLAVTLWNHLAAIVYRASNSPVNGVTEFTKNNVLLIGPTGSGKTHMLRVLSRISGLPLVIADATKLVQSGYVGGQVEELFTPLLVQSDYDLELAQVGIVFIDEIDKIRSNNSASGGPDVNGGGVQRALLTAFNGCKISCKTEKGNINFDTSNVLFICAGAFEGLDRIIETRICGASTIGYGGKIVRPEEDIEKRMQLLLQVSSVDLIKFGMISEFVGRLPIRTAVQHLTRDDLLRILTQPKNSLVSQARALVSPYFDLAFKRDALEAIADEAYSQGTGARALQEILGQVSTRITYMMPQGRFEVTSEMVANRAALAAETADLLVGAEIKPFTPPKSFVSSLSVSGEKQGAEALSDSSQILATAPELKAPTVETFTEIWSRGTYSNGMKLVETGDGTLKYIIRRSLIIKCCVCGRSEYDVPWGAMVDQTPGIDPFSVIGTAKVKWLCKKCSTHQIAEYTERSSEWRAG